MAGLNNIPQVPCGLFFLLIQLVDVGEDIVVVMTPHHWGAVIAGSHNAALSDKLAADVRQEFVLHHSESDSRVAECVLVVECVLCKNVREHTCVQWEAIRLMTASETRCDPWDTHGLIQETHFSPLVMLATEIEESWPTQHSLFPDGEKETECTQPPGNIEEIEK